MNHPSVTSVVAFLLVGCGSYSPAIDRPAQADHDDGTSTEDDARANGGATGTLPSSQATPSSEKFRGVYITSRKSLYRFDVAEKTVRKVGNYDCAGGADPEYERGAGMSDIAVDRHGRLYGVATVGTDKGLFVRIDPDDASCVEVQELGEFQLRGLAALSVHDSNDDDIVSSWQLNYVGVRMGVASLSMRGTVEVRPMGFVEDIVDTPWGVFAVDHSISTNARPRLVSITPDTGTMQYVVGTIDAFRVTGLAVWDDTLFGTTYDRKIVRIDPTTAAKEDVAADIEPGDDDFSGAAATSLLSVR